MESKTHPLWAWKVTGGKKKLLVTSSKGALVNLNLCNSPHPLMIPFHVERSIYNFHRKFSNHGRIKFHFSTVHPSAQHSKHSCSICNQNVVDYITSVWILMLTLLDLASHKMNSCIGRSLQSVKKLTDSSWFLRWVATSVWSITMVLKYHIIGCIALWGSICISFSSWLLLSTSLKLQQVKHICMQCCVQLLYTAIFTFSLRTQWSSVPGPSKEDYNIPHLSSLICKKKKKKWKHCH